MITVLWIFNRLNFSLRSSLHYPKFIFRDESEGEGENIKFSCAICRRQMKEPLVFEVFPSSMESSDDSDDEDLESNAVEDKKLPVLELKIAKLEAIIA